MKNIKKTYLLMILLLSLSVPSYACFPDTLEGWKDWCDQNGISYNEFTYSDALYESFLNSSDIFDRELPTLNVTAPKITNTPLTDLSTFGQEVPTNSSVWTAVLDPEPDYNPTNAKPRDCAGVEGGSAYLDNCQECVGGTTGKEACDCEGDKCPICGGLVVIESLSDLGLMKVAAADSKCRKCTCLRNYSKLHECDAYADMYKDALANKNEYCALLTTRGVHSWKTESPKEGEGFGPFSPKWDNTKHLWYIGSADNKEYIVGVAHVHWEEFEENFSGTGGDFSFAQTLHGAPLFLFNAQGEVKACFSPDGISCGYIPEFPSKYTIKSITDCSQSLLNYCSK